MLSAGPRSYQKGQFIVNLWRTLNYFSAVPKSRFSSFVSRCGSPTKNELENKICAIATRNLSSEATNKSTLVLSRLCHKHLRLYSSESSSSGSDDKGKGTSDLDPIRSFQKEVKHFTDNWKTLDSDTNLVPKETDMVIIGGGSFGMSAAFWLKRRNPEGFSVTVIERDPMYTQAASTLSIASIRHQFSLPQNIQMSMFGSEFFRDIKDYLSVLDLDPPDIQFNHQGYLLLSSDEQGAKVLSTNHEKQIMEGARIELLDPSQINQTFPWLNTEDITKGTYGLAGEGWFDPWLYLTALKVKCLSLGVKFVKGEAVGFQTSEHTGGIHTTGGVDRRTMLEAVQVLAEDGKTHPLKFAVCINCAGPWAGQVGRLAGIGTKDSGALSIPIPIEPRKRFVYVVHCPNGPGLRMPMLFDPSGFYIRREGLGGHYLCGASPGKGMKEPSTDNLDVDYTFFEEYIWPKLAHRIPAFEDLKIKSAWAGYYDYNYFDQNLIIGNHPYFRNFMIAAGCSGHGIQQSPAIGRAVAEYLLDSEFSTIDLSQFSFDRIMDDEPMFEESAFLM